MPSSDLDKAFELIEEGNELETNKEPWQAAAKYADACALLNKLADEAPSSTDEEKKIIELYQNKSRHYRQVGRASLMNALQHEHESDEGTETLVISSLSPQDSERRIQTFSILFSKVATSVGEKTSMLEERLMELNASLPSGFKTEKERLADINRGLGRLGLSLYPNSNHSSSSHVVQPPPPSEEDQVAQIIAQAQDQVRFEKPSTSETNEAASGEDEDMSSESISSQESSADSISSANDLLDSEPTFKNRKAIRHEVIKSQVKLAELVAMISTEEPDIILNENEKDDATESDSEKEKAEFDVAYGKATLVAARDCLNKALKEWPDDS